MACTSIRPCVGSYRLRGIQLIIRSLSISQITGFIFVELSTYTLKRMNLHPDIPRLHLERRAHGLTGPLHIHRIAQLRLARIDQALRLESLALLCPRIFELLSVCGITGKAYLLVALARGGLVETRSSGG